MASAAEGVVLEHSSRASLRARAPAETAPVGYRVSRPRSCSGALRSTAAVQASCANRDSSDHVPRQPSKEVVLERCLSRDGRVRCAKRDSSDQVPRQPSKEIADVRHPRQHSKETAFPMTPRVSPMTRMRARPGLPNDRRSGAAGDRPRPGVRGCPPGEHCGAPIGFIGAPTRARSISPPRSEGSCDAARWNTNPFGLTDLVPLTLTFGSWCFKRFRSRGW